MVITKQFQIDVETILVSAFSKPEFLQKVCESIAETICEKVEQEILKISEQQNKIQDEVQIIKAKVSKTEYALNKKIDNIEQSTRKRNLRVFGLAETQTENVVSLIIEFFSSKLGITVVPSEIERCHRVGKYTENKSRGIFITFTSYQKRMEVFESKKKLKGEKQTIKEDLTKMRLQIYQEAVGEFGIKNCWTKNGQIFVISNGKIQPYYGSSNEDNL